MAAAAMQSSRITPLEHTCIGALAGSFEVCINQPTVAIKNALQEGRPIPWAPKALYRGLLMNVLSMAPITATQFGSSRLIENAIVAHNGGGQAGTSGRFASAALAGAVSALVASPSELVIIQQQKSGRPLAVEVRSFLSSYGALPVFRGLPAAVARESMYAAGYLGLTPVLKDHLDSLPEMQEYPTGTSLIVSSITGGVFAAIASQPFDTIKTRMQAFMYSKPEYMSLPLTARHIMAEGGVSTFWRGITPRLFRIIGATFILNSVRTHICVYLDAQRAAAEL